MNAKRQEQKEKIREGMKTENRKKRIKKRKGGRKKEKCVI